MASTRGQPGPAGRPGREPSYGRVVADGIPGSHFEVLAEEAHQPFQEAPDLFNARVDAFWRGVEAQD